jgi:eukaryotic-like serine/threonine-protein kinase
MELAPDFILKERYQIMRSLGHGGMGAVYLAHDTVLDHVVAVKANHSPAEEAEDQFLKEARLLAALRHPTLPRVTDYFVIDEEQYLVMDYVPGDSFEVILKEDGIQPLEMVLQWAQQLGSAISYLHRQKPPVIHRDIKPANIKLMPSGEVMLVDFGIAKVSDGSQATTAGAQGFTPGYSPPEQYGGAHTGPYSDQYSLAATLYQLLTNHQPEDGLQRLMGTAVLAPMKVLNPKVPEGMQAVIERAMSPKPEERFASVDAFIDALAPFASQTLMVKPEYERPKDGKKKEPGTLTPSDSLPRKKKPPVWAFIVGGVILLALLVGGIALLSGGGHPKAPSETNAGAGNILATSVAATLTRAAAVIPPEDTPVPQSTAAQPTIAPTETLPAPTQAAAGPNLIGKGGYIAYISNKGKERLYQVWLMKVAMDESGAFSVVEDKQLTTDAGDKSYPAWSPDGKKLLYSAPSGGKALGIDIWMLDLEKLDQPAVNLSQMQGEDNEAAWSPDGNLIAFTNRGANGNDLRQLYLMNADGSSKQRLSRDYQEFSPAWSPDGVYLAYVITASSHYILYFRTAADEYASPMQYDTHSVLGNLGDVAEPAFSPVGDQMAYTRVEGASRTIFLTRFNDRGSRTTPVTQTGNDYEPAFSSDGQWIAFTSGRSGNPDIFLMNSAGNQQTNLTKNPAVEKMPAWQPLP